MRQQSLKITPPTVAVSSSFLPSTDSATGGGSDDDDDDEPVVVRVTPGSRSREGEANGAPTSQGRTNSDAGEFECAFVGCEERFDDRDRGIYFHTHITKECPFRESGGYTCWACGKHFPEATKKQPSYRRSAEHFSRGCEESHAKYPSFFKGRNAKCRLGSHPSQGGDARGKKRSAESNDKAPKIIRRLGDVE